MAGTLRNDIDSPATGQRVMTGEIGVAPGATSVPSAALPAFVSPVSVAAASPNSGGYRQPRLSVPPLGS